MTHHKVEQNTEDWLNLRMGKFTASTFKNLMSTKTTQGYKNEIYRVVFERMTGERPENFETDYMIRGHELENDALTKYEIETGNIVDAPGFFEISEFIGASPDGLIGKEGTVEIKCPKYSTMIEYLLNKRLPAQYKYQVQGQLLVTERLWTDFVCYHPNLKLLVLRIERDEEVIKQLRDELGTAISKVLQIIGKIKE